MARVTGIGGVFLRSHDPKRLTGWYAEHLGVKLEPYGVTFSWNDEVPKGTGMTAWSVFPEDTKYFSPSSTAPSAPPGSEHVSPVASAVPQQVMINYRVDDLPTLLAALRKSGVWIDPKQQDEGYGRFAWIQDCDGNRVELWEPKAKSDSTG